VNVSSISSGAVSYNISGAAPYTTYSISLTTWTLANSHSLTNTIQQTTYPAALSDATLVTLTTTAVTYQFTPPAGATTYSYNLYDQRCVFLLSWNLSLESNVYSSLLLSVTFNSTGDFLSSGHLNIETSNRKRSGDDFVTINGLAANTAYNIRIFVSPETVGLFLQVTTAPTGKFLSLAFTFDRVGLTDDLIHKL